MAKISLKRANRNVIECIKISIVLFEVCAREFEIGRRVWNAL